MAHTPGPWTVGGQSDNPGEAEEIAAADRVIAWTADSYDDDDDEGHITQEDRANARLIAAAPELLAIAKWVRDNMEPLGKDPSDGVSGWRHMDATEVDSIVSGVLHFCDEAIAKAEGRTDDQSDTPTDR